MPVWILPAPANQLAIDLAAQSVGTGHPSPVADAQRRVGYETLGRVWQWLKGGSGEPGQE
jgi:hypothetical protein